MCRLQGALDRAHGARVELACPGPGLSGAELEALDRDREQTRERLADSRFDHEGAILDLDLAWSKWALACEKRLPTGGDEKMDFGFYTTSLTTELTDMEELR